MLEEKFEKQEKELDKFENLSNIFGKELLEPFKDNPQENSQKYFKEIKNELNNIYNNVYDKDPGLAEGYTLEQHTSMVINQFAKYYNQFSEKLPYYISKETFLQILSIHDLGKVSEEVQNLKKTGVEKDVWKEEEEKQTKIIVKEILENTGKLDAKRINIILEIIGEGSGKMDQIITGKITPVKMKEYLVEKSEELFIRNPEDLFNILEVYLICDAGAYTAQAVEDYREVLGDEKANVILEEYKKGEEVQFAGLGVTKWFEQKDNEMNFVNNDRFGDHKMKDWIDETRILLKK